MDLAKITDMFDFVFDPHTYLSAKRLEFDTMRDFLELRDGSKDYNGKKVDIVINSDSYLSIPPSLSRYGGREYPNLDLHLPELHDGLGNSITLNTINNPHLRSMIHSLQWFEKIKEEDFSEDLELRLEDSCVIKYNYFRGECPDLKGTTRALYLSDRVVSA